MNFVRLLIALDKRTIVAQFFVLIKGCSCNIVLYLLYFLSF